MVRMVIKWKAHPVSGVVIVDIPEIKTDGKKWLQSGTSSCKKEDCWFGSLNVYLTCWGLMRVLPLASPCANLEWDTHSEHPQASESPREMSSSNPTNCMQNRKCFIKVCLLMLVHSYMRKIPCLLIYSSRNIYSIK